MNVSVLDRKMRGLYTHYLDADLDLHLIPEQNMYVSSSTNWDSQDTPVSGSRGGVLLHFFF